MKASYVADLEPGQAVRSTFRVVACERRRTREGKPYFHLELADRTGVVAARQWDIADETHPYPPEAFLEVVARTESYRGQLQLVIQQCRLVRTEEIDPRDFFPHTDQDIDQLWQRLHQQVESVQNPWLHKLLKAILADPAVAEKLRAAPAALRMHHAYRGGLLEHVVSLCGLCQQVARHYPELNLDLLITGAVLHDIGKLDELRYEAGTTLSDEGRLLGHILLGLERVQHAVANLEGFPPGLARLVEHLIASHHGRPEFGAPRLPLFREALVLHYLDDLDSKLAAIRAVFGDARNETEWSPRIPALDRSLLRIEQFLRRDTQASPETPASSPASLFGDDWETS